ncbi:MAG: Mur ligase domain-containing protein, partial [Thermoplasmata archaeon]
MEEALLRPRDGAHVHLIGICGTAMAGLAGLLRARGFRVTGSDEGVYPPMSTYLEGIGIRADSGFDERHLDPPPDLVVIGNAIRRGNPEAEATLDRRLSFTSLPVLVKELLLPGKRVAVVAGTHGKTTTSSMMAHILGATGEDPSFLIGGIPLAAGAPARMGGGPAFILEGDEYDTAFF